MMETAFFMLICFYFMHNWLILYSTRAIHYFALISLIALSINLAEAVSPAFCLSPFT